MELNIEEMSSDEDLETRCRKNLYHDENIKHHEHNYDDIIYNYPRQRRIENLASSMKVSEPTRQMPTRVQRPEMNMEIDTLR